MITRTHEEIITEIKELIAEKIQPAVESDGGMIIFQGFDNGIVSVNMLGACSGCPSSQMTLKEGIENMLKFYVPEVEEVVAI